MTVLALLLGLLSATGCATGVVDVGNWYGVGYRLQTGPSIDIRDDGADLHVRTSGYTLDVVGGRLRLDGADLGSVSPGDHVDVTASGRLAVNGVPRTPGATPTAH